VASSSSAIPSGNAAFITSLYVVLVPILGLFLGRRVSARGWAAALLAIVGLYIISVGGRFSVSPGDFLELAGSFFWACHIIIIGRLAGKTEAVELSVGQFLVCAALSLCASFLLDPPFPGGGWLPALRGAFIPIMYGGLLSSALAFTLQIVAQRTARPSHASIIMALEGLFGAIGGILILGEPLTWKLAAGGCLMLSGAILSQLEPPAPKPGVAAAEKKS
jgi:drug/metabolite transporter (DMT)-like permease